MSPQGLGKAESLIPRGIQQHEMLDDVTDTDDTDYDEADYEKIPEEQNTDVAIIINVSDSDLEGHTSAAA